MTKEGLIKEIKSLDIPELTHDMRYIDTKRCIRKLSSFFSEKSRVVKLLENDDRIIYYEGDLFRLRKTTQRHKNTRKRSMVMECMDFMYYIMKFLDSGASREELISNFYVFTSLEYIADFSRFLQEYEYIESNYPDKSIKEKNEIYKGY